jgi:hypothetical protein
MKSTVAFLAGIGVEKAVVAFHIHFMERRDTRPDEADDQPEGHHGAGAVADPGQAELAFRRRVGQFRKRVQFCENFLLFFFCYLFNH